MSHCMFYQIEENGTSDRSGPVIKQSARRLLDLQACLHQRLGSWLRNIQILTPPFKLPFIVDWFPLRTAVFQIFEHIYLYCARIQLQKSSDYILHINKSRAKLGKT